MPDALGRVLRARSVDPVHARSAHAAMAELCVAQHAGRRAALILADPPDPARLLAAAERFAPGAVVWIYRPGANPPLRPFVHTADPRPAEERPTRPEGRTNGVNTRHGRRQPGPESTPEPPPPPMRPVRENTLKPAHPPADPTRTDRPLSARDILDDDELHMLLAGGPAKEDDPR